MTHQQISEQLRLAFEEETGMHWTNSQDEPDIDYVLWLEQKIHNNKQTQL